IARCNMFLRTAERVMLVAGVFKAYTFDELFENVKALPWEDLLPKNAEFPVKKASSVNSKLFSPSDIQSIVKKAVVDRLRQKYGDVWFAEDGDVYPIRVFINKDEVTVALDTTGESLHKRGYRQKSVAAPVSETLAAALIMLTPWKKDRILVDPFCGGGTFPIEAAMMAANIAPGMNRAFTAEKWENVISKRAFYDAADEAYDLMDTDIETQIQGYDIDDDAVKLARIHAENAGVEKFIHFQRRDVKDLSHSKKYGFIITNPPYGERLSEREALPELYRTMGEAFRRLDSWSYFVLTAFEDAPSCMGMMPDKNRKVYNGMIKTYFYEFFGEKPPKRKRDDTV
ncbi:MAG: class I SAM-dependent RNA methyltransferase, partial [Lachnospiraceae bacterium]|nr:class I SAM-dependent RNA methyltransferase [Lachnospiraceae bacterium]